MGVTGRGDGVTGRGVGATGRGMGATGQGGEDPLGLGRQRSPDPRGDRGARPAVPRGAGRDEARRQLPRTAGVQSKPPWDGSESERGRSGAAGTLGVTHGDRD